MPVGALIKQAHGGALRNGGTNKGGAGRPPDAWKAECQRIASSDAQPARAEKVLKDIHHPAWLSAWRFVAEHGYGRPNQTVELSGKYDFKLADRIKAARLRVKARERENTGA